MKQTLLNSLLCSSALLMTGLALAQEPDPCAIDSKLRTDGTVELSNIGHATKCEVAPGSRTPVPATAAPAAPTAPATQPAPAAAPVAASPVAVDNSNANPAATPSDSSSSADQKDRRETYRDAMLVGTPGTTAANPAVSRRYKMMDKATYQEKVLNGAAPQSDAGSGSQ